MAIYDRNGGYVGGCQAQILGAVLSFLYLVLMSKGITFWTIAKWIVLALIGYGALRLIVWRLKELLKTINAKKRIKYHLTSKLGLHISAINIIEFLDKFDSIWFNGNDIYYSRLAIKITYTEEDREKNMYKYIYLYKNTVLLDKDAKHDTDDDGNIVCTPYDGEYWHKQYAQDVLLQILNESLLQS